MLFAVLELQMLDASVLALLAMTGLGRAEMLTLHQQAHKEQQQASQTT